MKEKVRAWVRRVKEAVSGGLRSYGRVLGYVRPQRNGARETSPRISLSLQGRGLG